MNQPILITGCQRSGTTLLNLILNSHPAITAIDEMDFDVSQVSHYLTSPDFHPCIALKLPTIAHEVASFESIPALKVLWCIRDPRDTITSMVKLPLSQQEGKPLCWSLAPVGGLYEISSALKVLGCTFSPERLKLAAFFQQIQSKPSELHTHQDALFCAALCWRLKQELLSLYSRLHVSHFLVRYEHLVRNPEDTLRQVLSFLTLPWDDEVLHHDRLHQGIAVGDTDRSRPIESSSIGKWQTFLTHDDLRLIESLCGQMAAKYGYNLSINQQFPKELSP